MLFVIAEDKYHEIQVATNFIHSMLNICILKTKVEDDFDYEAFEKAELKNTSVLYDEIGV